MRADRIRLRSLRDVSAIERIVLGLLRRRYDHSGQSQGVAALSVSPFRIQPFDELGRYGANVGLTFHAPNIDFIHDDEMAVLLAIAGLQRPSLLTVRFPDSNLLKHLNACAEEVSNSGRRLPLRPHMQATLDKKGWCFSLVAPTGRSLARRREAAASKPPATLREGTLGKRAIELLRTNGSMTSHQLQKAGVSRQYLSLLTADGLVLRTGTNQYIVGPRAPGIAGWQ